jgi:hypothetical protein
LLRKLIRKVFWEPFEISGYLLIEARRCNSIESGKVGIKHHPLPANNPDHVLNILRGKPDVGGAFFGHDGIALENYFN